MDQVKIGKFISDERKAKGYTQKQLSELLGISQVFVTGVKEITTTPALFSDVLEYEGKFYRGVDIKVEAEKEVPKVREDKAR